MKVLVIDVGGTNVKLLLRGEDIPRKCESGPKLTAEPMVKEAKEIVADWKYEACRSAILARFYTTARSSIRATGERAGLDFRSAKRLAVP
jgi:hypothetical protein